MAEIDIVKNLVLRAARGGAAASAKKYRVTDGSDGAAYIVTIEREGYTKASVLAEGRIYSASPTGSGEACGCCGGTGRAS